MSRQQYGLGYARGLEQGRKTNQPLQRGNFLAGKFFHSLGEDGKVKWQGFVLGSPEPGWYLVQLFEWLMGEPNVCKLVQFEEMSKWLFYQDQESMIFSYEYGVASRLRLVDEA